MSAWTERLTSGRWGRLRRMHVLAAGALLALGVAGLAARRGPEGELPEPVVVKQSDLVLSVEVEGELKAVRSAEIGPPPVNEWEFKIASMAAEGAEVKRGQPVLAFDTETLQRQLDQKRAELQEAETKLEQKGVDLRMKTLDLDQRIAQGETDRGKAELKAEVPLDLVARVEAQKARLELEGVTRDLDNLKAERRATLARAESEARSLAAQRDRARGRVKELVAAIQRMTLLAPQDGIVLHRTDWRDEKKKVGDRVWRGEILLSIPDLSEMWADASVDEADGGHVAVGQSVTLRLEARPDLDIRGKVSSLAQTVRRKSSRVPAKVFKVVVALERTDSTFMRPAMRFRGEIETGRIPALVLLPREAVFLRETGPVVFVRRRLGWAEMRVKLGQSNRRLVEIVEGPRAGEAVLPFDLAARLAARPGAGPGGSR